ncbi:hypothetical protein Glove_81g70 [Diversispora epigaea]|uniref:Protein kinase domain-containing protein n=1 Tax=Diversispora epigaea TaxID=1348612 RepID=A0A397JHL9_9GLOM|nr:hypothetical protein Glove_81g70 [Diversispora epigaea]
MSHEKEIMYCPDGHSSNDIIYNNRKNDIDIFHGKCELCTKEHIIQEFGTWSCGNVEIDKVVQESQKNYQGYYGYQLQWIPYDNFRDIEHIADGRYGSVYSAISKNGIKWYWNFNKQNWKYYYVGKKALKEINDSKYDISGFLKEIQSIQIVEQQSCITRCIGISKNPFTQNYIIVMDLYDNSLHKFLTKNFGNLRSKTKIGLLCNITTGLNCLHVKNLVHRDLHSGNILIRNNSNSYDASITDLGLCKLETGLILKSDNKSNNIYGSIPYIPPEVLRGNSFTKEGDIYSFGGIMYEMATGKLPFYDRAHDTHLIIDICKGIRPRIPDVMLDWIPKSYSDLMYQCWSDDPSNRPIADEFYDLYEKIYQQFKITDENQEKEIKSEKHESFLSSSISHPQSCYISRSIHALHGLHNSLEDIKSGKFQDPNLLKSNESTASSVSTYDIDSKESQECIDWEKEIQNHAKKDHSLISQL